VIPPGVEDFLRAALDEDIGPGDITTALTVDAAQISSARVIAKGHSIGSADILMVLAGLPFFEKVFALVDSNVRVTPLKSDGDELMPGDEIACVEGRTVSLLVGERLALNILQRLSGIATLTRAFVNELRGLDVKIVDTRKTTPNMRYMEKYAVRMGGGANHRFGLFDGVLIKDNHIKAAGGISEAVRRVRGAGVSRGFGGAHHLLKIEVEVKNLVELNEALDTDAEVIMLDNMSLDDMKQAVVAARARRPVLIEASGNVTLENVRRIAQCGVDLISAGMLTHSAPAADISMKIV
jgi:nicotinate-nucleotide pyrophosphorylase (carboxylating)